MSQVTELLDQLAEVGEEEVAELLELAMLYGEAGEGSMTVEKLLVRRLERLVRDASVCGCGCCGQDEASPDDDDDTDWVESDDEDPEFLDPEPEPEPDELEELLGEGYLSLAPIALATRIIARVDEDQHEALVQKLAAKGKNAAQLTMLLEDL